MREPKYHAIRTVCGQGHHHDSKSEAAYCGYLELRRRAAEIVHVDVHPVVSLPAGVQWRLDFAIWGVSRHVLPQYVDVKGMQTEAFRLKRKLFDAHHPAAPLLVVKRKGKGWVEV